MAIECRNNNLRLPWNWHIRKILLACFPNFCQVIRIVIVKTLQNICSKCQAYILGFRKKKCCIFTFSRLLFYVTLHVGEFQSTIHTICHRLEEERWQRTNIHLLHNLEVRNHVYFWKLSFSTFNRNRIWQWTWVKFWHSSSKRWFKCH